MAASPNFRTALNGFNRMDVVSFIQAQTSDHEREVRALRDENARLQQELEDARRELEEARAAAAEVAAIAEEVTLKASAAEAPALDAPIAPAATVVEAMPTNINEMELAAYRRAEMTERLARERASASTERMKSVFAQADKKLNLTTQDLVTMMDAFRNDFDQLQQVLNTAHGIFNESTAGIQAASDMCCEP